MKLLITFIPLKFVCLKIDFKWFRTKYIMKKYVKKLEKRKTFLLKQI